MLPRILKSLFVITVLTYSQLMFAQASSKVLILSDRVGSPITKEQKEYFNLFQEFSDFQSAVIYEKDKKLCEIHIILEDSETNYDTVYTISKKYFQRLSDYIDNYEVFKTGHYVLGTLSEKSPLGEITFTGSGNVIVKLGDESEIQGELISVRYESMIISTGYYEFSEEDFEEQKEELLIVPYQEIDKIILEGKSNFLPGLGYGVLGGAALGAILGFASGDDPPNQFLSFSASDKAVILGVLFAGVGLVIGGIIGAATPESDLEIEPSNPGNILNLKQFAKYPKEEPEFLREFI